MYTEKNPSICHLSLEYILKKRNPLGAISKNKWHIPKLRIQFFQCTRETFFYIRKTYTLNIFKIIEL